MYHGFVSDVNDVKRLLFLMRLACEKVISVLDVMPTVRFVVVRLYAPELFSLVCKQCRLVSTNFFIKLLINTKNCFHSS